MRGAVDDGPTELQHGIARLEGRYGGRLGVAVLDTATMKRVGHRGDERFAMCSTFKLLAAACVLARVDRHQESLTRRIVYSRDSLQSYSPITGKHAGGDGLTYPPNRAPIVVTVYYSEAHGTDAERSAVVAEVGRLVAKQKWWVASGE